MRSDLHYPFQDEPGTGDGSAVGVAPGVLWLRMPVFASLPWINVWAIADEGGWTLIDTGLHNETTIAAWQMAMAGVLGGARVVRVLATHMHPDHCGMAGWMAERFQARLWMTREEYLTGRVLAADVGPQGAAEGSAFYRAAGWDDIAIERYQAEFGAFGALIHPLPRAYHRMMDGHTLQIGAHSWTVVIGAGHSPEHACLYCPALKLLISGDQVLPKISSNISVYPTEPDADPLTDWLDSLVAIPERIPDDVLVLPAHNSPFHGLHARCRTLIQAHRDGLHRLEQLLAEPKRVVDVFPALFARPIVAGLLEMATGEALAHLNFLTGAGRATRCRDAAGVWWWQTLR